MNGQRSIYVAAKLQPEPASPNDPIAAWLTQLLGPERPRRLARMLDPGGDKYRDVARHVPLDQTKLLSHASGVETWAATLDQNGMSRAGVIEVDTGGRAAVLAVLAAAHTAGLVCWAIAVDNPLSGHSGGHVWFIYTENTENIRIVAQLQQIVSAAGLPADTELWPNNQVIRLPFGYHRWAKTRGALILQSGELLDLDTDAVTGLCAVTALPANAAPPAVVEPVRSTKKAPDASGASTKKRADDWQENGRFSTILENTPAQQDASAPVYGMPRTAKQPGMLANVSIPAIDSIVSNGAQTSDKAHYLNTGHVQTRRQPHASAKRGRIDTAAIFAEARDRFNADHEWAELLSEYGGTEVQTGYWACDCGVGHTHGIQIAVTSQDKIISLSNRCGWARDDKALDKFGFWCDQAHGGNYRAAAEAAAREYGLWVEPARPRATTPAPEPPPSRTPEQIADAERKRTERRTAAAATLDQVQARASQDAALSDRAQLVLLALLETAGTRDWTRASVARLAELTELCERYIHDGLRELEARGYIASGRRNGSTTFRTFIRLQDYVKLADESNKELVPTPDLSDLVSRAPLPQAENVYASTLDDWAWSEVEHSADELTRLDQAPGETSQDFTPKKASVLNTEPPEQRAVEPGFSDNSEAIKSELPAGWALRRSGPFTYATDGQRSTRPGSDAGAVCAAAWLLVEPLTPRTPEKSAENPTKLNILQPEPPDTAQNCDYAILDEAEIDRMVAEIQAVADARRDERSEPRHYWEKHEARVFREVHPVAPLPPASYQQAAERREADRARIRAQWDAIGDNPSELGRRLGTLRGRLKKYPQSRPALEWQIRELHDRLAALTPVADAMERARSQARRPTAGPAPGMQQAFT